MKKSHKREIFVARVTFAIFLVVVALIVALIVVLISSHINKTKETKNSQKAPVTNVSDTPVETIPEVPDTEGIIEDGTQAAADAPASGDDETGTGDTAAEGDNAADTPAEPAGGTSGEKRWTTDSVRFRVEPNTECEVITGISPGTEVEFIAESGEWSQVKFDGRTGYIKSEFLTATAPQ